MESDINLEQLTIDEITSPHPFKGEDKYTIFFVVKVAILTFMFTFLWLMLFPLEAPRYNDHTDMRETPGKKNSREIDTSAP